MSLLNQLRVKTNRLLEGDALIGLDRDNLLEGFEILLVVILRQGPVLDNRDFFPAVVLD